MSKEHEDGLSRINAAYFLGWNCMHQGSRLSGTQPYQLAFMCFQVNRRDKAMENRETAGKRGKCGAIRWIRKMAKAKKALGSHGG